MRKSATTYILWIVFICLLLVLLPHTAWAFESMEPAGGKYTAWIAAIAFESAIAVLVHKLSKHMEGVGKRKGWSRTSYMYLNAFAFGLVAVTMVSVLANLAHAVEFGTSLKIFAEWGIPQEVYSVAFGGILPVVSLLFARILSNVTESEEERSPELVEANTKLEQAKGEIRRLTALVNTTEAQAKAAIRSAEDRIQAAEAQMKTAEVRFGALADLVNGLVSDNKRERILTVKRQWPALSGNAIAVIADAKPSYVSEVINAEAIDVTAELTQQEQTR